MRHPIHDPAKGNGAVMSDDLQDLPLSLGEVMRYAMRGDVAAG